MDKYLIEFKNKKKSNKNNKLKSITTKILLSIIFILLSLIYINYSQDNLVKYKEYIFTESMSFTKFRSWYEDIFGSVLPKEETDLVFGNSLIYKSINSYLDGEALEVNSNIINSIASGIVVYSGVKDDYGNTVIIQGIDGVDIWYGNLDTISVDLYDYIETDSIIGSVLNNTLYLVIKENNEYKTYEEYQNR